MAHSKKKIRFIINPKAGITPKSKPVIDLLASGLIPASRFECQLHFTERQGHAIEIARQSVEEGIDIIVAAGGDGTVNEVASALAGTGAIMGILPSGSGNGLARCLGIPMTYTGAVRTLLEGKPKTIDSAQAGDHFFCSIAGTGFDAHVAAKFANSQLRGLLSYMRITFQEFPLYKPANYVLSIDGKVVEREAFMIVLANGDQFGFQTRIAPQAKPDDGLLDVCVIPKISAFGIPATLFRLLSGQIDRSENFEFLKGEQITLNGDNLHLMNIDGEPRKINSPVDIKINPQSLRVIVP